MCDLRCLRLAWFLPDYSPTDSLLLLCQSVPATPGSGCQRSARLLERMSTLRSRDSYSVATMALVIMASLIRTGEILRILCVVWSIHG